jgi:hypothetical protein
MTDLESQEDETCNRVLWFKPMSWLGQISPHRRDEDWSTSLWQTFFVTVMDDQIPVITQNPLVVCGWKKFQIDSFEITKIINGFTTGETKRSTCVCQIVRDVILRERVYYCWEYPYFLWYDTKRSTCVCQIVRDVILRSMFGFVSDHNS